MAQRVKIAFFGLLGVFLFLTGCKPTPSMRGPQNLEANYEEQLVNWTTSGRVDYSLDRMLIVYATYLAPTFREAFGSQYLSVFGIDPGKVDSDLEMIATSVGRGHEFFVFADIPHDSWNNLEEADTVWRMALWGGPEQLGVPPMSIHKFRGRGPNLKAFFPYLNDFGRSYLVLFPYNQANGRPVLEPEHGKLTVKLASAFGRVSLSWKVDR